MSQKEQAIQSLIKIQTLLGELGFVLTQTGYHKDYGLHNGGISRIIPVFDTGISTDMQYNLSALSVAGEHIIPIVAGQPIALDKIPGECRVDVMRMLAELSPNALLPKIETFIISMNCTSCKESVNSYLNIEGVVTCLACAGYE